MDGTLIEAWASAKSFKPKDGPPPSSDSRGGVDFRGSTRTNDTHGSTTDPEAMSARRGKGKEAKLCFGGHALMENRNGLGWTRTTGKSLSDMVVLGQGAKLTPICIPATHALG